MKTVTRYAVTGFATTAADFGIFVLMSAWFGLSALLSHAIATSIILPISFLGQRNLAFRSQGRVNRQALEFVLVTVSNVTLVQPIVLLLVPWPIAAKVVAICVGIAWNFCWFNGLIFSTKRGRR